MRTWPLSVSGDAIAFREAGLLGKHGSTTTSPSNWRQTRGIAGLEIEVHLVVA